MLDFHFQIAQSNIKVEQEKPEFQVLTANLLINIYFSIAHRFELKYFLIAHFYSKLIVPVIDLRKL